MASLLAMAVGAGVNALAFFGTNYLFSHIDKNKADEERRRHDEAVEKLQKSQKRWSQQRMEKLDFYNKYLHDQNLAAQNIDDIVDAAHQYYLATGEKQTLALKPVLSDFYHPSDEQKTGEIVFIVGSLGMFGFFRI